MLALTHPRDLDAPLSLTPVPDPRSRTFGSATANALYLVRRPGHDLFGQTPDFADRLALGSDLADYGRRGPIGSEADAIAGTALWSAADRAAVDDRPGTPVAYHAIGWLPAHRPRETRRELVLEFLDQAVVTNGMVADWAIPALAGEDGRWIRKPHAHILLTHRFRQPGRRTGEPNPVWCGHPSAAPRWPTNGRQCSIATG